MEFDKKYLFLDAFPKWDRNLHFYSIYIANFQDAILIMIQRCKHSLIHNIVSLKNSCGKMYFVLWLCWQYVLLIRYLQNSFW